MRLINFDDFQKAMEKRGWNADAYLKEVGFKMAIRDFWNDDCTCLSVNNNGYIDEFRLVILGKIEDNFKFFEPVCFFGEISTPNNK